MSASDSFIPNLYSELLTAAGSPQKTISRELFRSLVVFSELFADFLSTAACIFAVFFFHLRLGHSALFPVGKIAVASAVVGLSEAFLLQRFRENHASCTLVQIRETEHILRTAIQCQFLLFLVSYLLELQLTWSPCVLALLFISACLLIQKRVFAFVLQRLHAGGYGADRVVVYGSENTCALVASSLARSPHSGLYPVALVRDDNAPSQLPIFRLKTPPLPSIPVLSAPLTAAALKILGCDLLVVSFPRLSSGEIACITGIAEQAQSSIAFCHAPAAGYSSAPWFNIEGLTFRSNARPVAAWHSVFIKRAADTVIASIFLLLCVPLFLFIAVLIRVDSPGPAFFVQKRVGRNGELFNIFKFRSMYRNVPDYEPSPIRSSDPRITPIGRILRRTSLDELPQLLNVLLGSMSLVGPRPEMPFLVQRYSQEHRERLQLNPGITGLWQLSTDRRRPIHENIQYDLYYIRNRTFCMDMAILLHTLSFAMRGGV